MSYQVLARKYRPKSFETLVGQEHVVRALSHALEQQRLHHAYLFTGTRGVGKTTLSRILAKSFNCIGADGNGGITSRPCGVCEACIAIDAGRFVDYIEMDAASNRGVDEMAALLEQAVYAPSNARFKVYMIDEVHMLTNHAFNSMLKTLEEPPEHVKFILATTDPQKIPVTVLSRCLQFNLKQMPPGHIVAHLENILGQEQIEFEVPALRLLAQGAHGSMRDALSLTDQSIAYAAGKVTLEAVQGMLGALDQSYLIRLLDALAVKEGKALLDVADEMAARSLSYKSALQDLGSLLHQIAIAQMVPDAVPEDMPERDDVIRLAALFGKEEIQLFYQIAVHGRNELALAPDEYAGFSMTLLRLLAFRPSDSGAAISGNTAGGPGGSAPSGHVPQRPIMPSVVSPVNSVRSVNSASSISGQLASSPPLSSAAIVSPTMSIAIPPVAPVMAVPAVESSAQDNQVARVAELVSTAQQVGEILPEVIPEALPIAAQVVLPATVAVPVLSPRDAALAAAGLRKPSVASRAAAAEISATRPMAAPVTVPVLSSAPARPTAPVASFANATQVVSPTKERHTSTVNQTKIAAPAGMDDMPPWDEDMMEASSSNELPPHFQSAAFDDQFDQAAIVAVQVKSENPAPPVNPPQPTISISAQTINASEAPTDSVAFGESPQIAARVTEIKPIPELNWDGHWPNLASSLPMRGVAQQLVQQSELIDCQINGNTFVFSLRVPLQTLLSSGSVEKLELALSERFAKTVKVETKIGAVEQTANAQAVAERAERQQLAEKSIQSDSFIQSLMREFGASIVTGSIKPV